MVWPTGTPKCPVSPEDRGECVEPPTGLVQCPKCLWWSNQIELHLCPSQTPMVADIAQILLNGHANGKSVFEIAEDILQEFERASELSSQQDQTP